MWLLTCLLLTSTLGALDEDGAAPARPNIIVVLADDLGLGDLGAYNPDSKIPTPYLDRLAAEGMRFTDAHSPSAVCTPTRYGVLTGRYAWRTRLQSGVFDGTSTNLIDPERITLPDLLRERGYRTACVGKWHLGLGDGEATDYEQPLRPGPLEHGFDTFFGIPASLDMTPYVYVLDHGVVQAASATVAASGHRRQQGGGFWRGGPAAPDFRHVEVLPRLAHRSIELIERFQREEPERPFFLYLPLTAPHTPWVPAPEFIGRSKAGFYGDFVVQVDAVVGQLLATLDRLGIADDTLLIFTSDNGSHWPVEDIERWGHAANLGYRGQKADIHEGGHRVPLVVRWPGTTPAGTERHELLGLTDLVATLASITGYALPVDAGEDSVDQSALLRGEIVAEAPRRDIVHHSFSGLFAIRDGPWKLVLGLGSGGFTAPQHVEPEDGGPRGQLFQLERDPGEQVDLWSQRQDVVARLEQLLERQQTSGGSR